MQVSANMKARQKLFSDLLKPACDSIIVAIGLGLPLVVAVAGVLVVNDTPSSRLLVVTAIPPLRSPRIRFLPMVTGTPPLGSQVVAISGLPLVKGWGHPL